MDYHFPLGLVPIRILDPPSYVESLEQIVPPGHVERMRRPGAERAEPKPIKRHIERDQSVFRNLEHEVAA